ncbi:MAG: recombinase family protein [Gammaproteobacteria bacterium]|nr:recombinase family protein [Gammaproteobacteria bacterium]
MTPYEGMTAVIYVRSSTDDKGQRPDMQVEDCRKFCDLNKMQVMEVFRDEGFSGGTLDRPGLQLMIGYLMTHQVSMIVAQDPSRISRSNDDMESLLRIIKPRGTVLRYTSMQIRPEDGMEKTINYIATNQGEQWREMHSLKVRKGLNYAKKHGTKSGRPIGRPKVDIDMELVVECAAKGTTLYAASKTLGYSYSTMQRKLRENGLITLFTNCEK